MGVYPSLLHGLGTIPKTTMSNDHSQPRQLLAVFFVTLEKIDWRRYGALRFSIFVAKFTFRSLSV
jgi:hypothetical protein